MLLQTAAIFLDVVSVFIAFWLSYYLRYHLSWGGIVATTEWADFTTFLGPAFFASGLVIIVFPIRGVYQFQHKWTLLDYVPRVLESYSIVIATVILVAFFFQFTPSRLIYLFAATIGTTLMLIHRFAMLRVRAWLHTRHIGVDRVVIVGVGENARRIMQTMVGHVGLGYDVIGFVAANTAPDEMIVGTEQGLIRRPRLGDEDHIRDILQTCQPDQIYVVGGSLALTDHIPLMEICRETGTDFLLVPSLLQISVDRVAVSEINGVPTIGLRDASIRGINAIVKRSLDLAIAIPALIVMAIPMIAIAILIKRDSPGPVFYLQTRVGQYGKPFTMIKFRAMVSNADQMWSELVTSRQGADGRLFKYPTDPRVTHVGKHLRKMSLDELPQLCNIIRGDMSIVGPRPALPREVDKYDAWHRQRLLVRPGLTGLWQVNGRSDLSFDQMVRLDLYYAENWSVWLDIKTILRTVPAVLLQRGAY